MTSKKTGENFEEILRQEWDNYPDLRDEFLDKFKIYFHFKKAEAEGLVKYTDIEEKIKVLKMHPNKDLLIVKEFVDEIRNSNAGKRKRGKEGPVKLILRRLLIKLEIFNLSNILEAMENSDLLDDICYHPSNPAPMRNIEVDREKQIVVYDTLSGDTKSITFSRLRSTISEIKKTNQ